MMVHLETTVRIAEQPIMDAVAFVESLPSPFAALDSSMRFAFANAAAEQLFQASFCQMRGRRLEEFVRPHGRLLELIDQVRRSNASMSEFGLNLNLRRGVEIEVDAHVAPVNNEPGSLVLGLQPASMARSFDRHRVNRGSRRSISAMARMLAHEIRNPLSGIRGAAQLLNPVLEEEDRPLTRLICDEVDRICRLVDRMEAFGEPVPIERMPLNIHEILEHVRLLAESGFARNLQIIERYDPSLPKIDGDRDKLIQLFLNLVKNAAEAAPATGGQIVIKTHYQHGVRVSLPNTRSKVDLPITVEIQDNGPGADPDLVEDMFEPFVSSKPGGSGLGLSLVAKITSDHGGIVSYGNEDEGSVVRVRLAASVRDQQTELGV